MQKNYSIYDIVSETEWQALFAKAHFQHMAQTWPFGEAKRAIKWRPRRIAIQLDGQPVAICQVLYKMIAGFPVAARINPGPMMLTGHTEKEMDVLLAIRQHWRYLRHGVLLIQPAIIYSEEAVRALKAMGFRLRNEYRWKAARVDLTRSEEDMRKSLASDWRRPLNKSERLGLQLIVGNSTEDLEWLLQKHIESMAENDFHGPSPEFLRALYKAAPADFYIFRVIHAGVAVAVLMTLKFGDKAQNYIVWVGSEGRRLSAGNFLYWNAALELKRLGCSQVDLGGYNSATGFGAFKMGMNGTEYELAGEFVSL